MLRTYFRAINNGVRNLHSHELQRNQIITQFQRSLSNGIVYHGF